MLGYTERWCQASDGDPAAFRSKVTGVYDRFKPRIGAELMDKALAEVN